MTPAQVGALLAQWMRPSGATSAETLAVLKLGERDVVGLFDPDGTPRLGEILPLGVDMAHACLFDPATEALIPRERA